MWGCEVRNVVSYIQNHHIPAIQAVGKERQRNPKWSYWYIRRSVAEQIKYPKQGVTETTENWTEGANEFLLLARDVWHKGWADIGRLMKSPVTGYAIFMHYQRLKKLRGEEPVKGIERSKRRRKGVRI
jgi:hypothetical protein